MSNMDEKTPAGEKAPLTKKPDKADKADKKAMQKREVENFKRKYFDYYDDIKISVREDW